MTERTTQMEAYATRAQIRRMVFAARDAGICVGGVECTREGTIRVLTDASSPLSADTEYDNWKRLEGRK